LFYVCISDVLLLHNNNKVKKNIVDGAVYFLLLLIIYYSYIYLMQLLLKKSTCGLNAYAAAEHLLAKKRLQWRDYVFRFAPMPRSRHSPARSVSSAPTDKSDDITAAETGDAMSSDDGSRCTDEDQEKFYDAVADPAWLPTSNKEGPSTYVEEIFPSLHAEATSGASAWSETSSKGICIQEKEIVSKEPSPHTSHQASVLKADVINDSDTSLTSASGVEVITSEISTLSPEQLRLLKKLIKKKKICKQCSFKVDLEDDVVTLKGTEEDIMTTELAIYEALANASECNLNISKALGHLMTSSKGQQWFDEGCEHRSFLGICYVDNSVTKILAADDVVVGAMRNWLSDALHSERISYECHHLPFLQTREWTDFVRKLTDSQLLLITDDASKMEILVEGPADAVKTAVKEIDDLLNRECRINKKLPLKPADYRTLAFYCTDIFNTVQELR